MFNSLKDFNFQGKRVLLRCDFNVPIKDGKVLDDFRIKRTLPTLLYLKKSGAKIILLSHLGRPSTKTKKFSLAPVASKLEELLKEKVKFSKTCISKKLKKEIKKLKPGEILLLENLRFEKGEEANDENFAKSLAELGDVYVSEAFSVVHRNHASVAILPKLLPHFVGFDFLKEIEVLSQVLENPQHPLVVIIGGTKIASKIKIAERFLKIADHLLLGGYLAHIILRVKGICIGKPWPEEEVVKIIKNLDLTNPKLHLPVDVIVSPDQTGEIYTRQTSLGSVRKEEEIFDIGKETIQSFREILKPAKTIFWAGPLGYCEREKFSQGTKQVAEIVVRNYEAYKVVGGGDTISALRKFNLLDKFSFVSTGGGAMLAFLAGKKLPGLEALK
jgi:phosphoglycerate kinase